MNYRHAFHAGNFADVLKHAVLVACLEHLALKPAPFRVIDTHAGVGLYDLMGQEARRSPEWRDGVARLWTQNDLPALLEAYVAAVRALNPSGELRCYPGSPALIVRALRAQDRAAFCELHPADHALLHARYGADRRISVAARDGWAAVRALTPPPERRGLVLVDPPFEQPGDADRLVGALSDALARFATGTVLLWRPIKDARAESALIRALSGLGARALDITLQVGSLSGLGLRASGVTVVNPPWTLERDLADALPALRALMGRDDEPAHARVARISGVW